MNRPVSPPVIERISDLERRYVEECLDYGFEASKGSLFSSRLERAFADRLGVDFAISFINGTATMHAALEAAGVGPGDEVIVPPLTMASTAFVALQAHAVPVFADIDPETFQISSESIRQRITPFTRAIIPVALYGLTPDMDSIMALAAGTWPLRDRRQRGGGGEPVSGTAGRHDRPLRQLQLPEHQAPYQRRGRHDRDQ